MLGYSHTPTRDRRDWFFDHAPPRYDMWFGCDRRTRWTRNGILFGFEDGRLCFLRHDSVLAFVDPVVAFPDSKDVSSLCSSADQVFEHGTPSRRELFLLSADSTADSRAARYILWCILDAVSD